MRFIAKNTDEGREASENRERSIEEVYIESRFAKPTIDVMLGCSYKDLNDQLSDENE